MFPAYSSAQAAAAQLTAAAQLAYHDIHRMPNAAAYLPAIQAVQGWVPALPARDHDDGAVLGTEVVTKGAPVDAWDSEARARAAAAAVKGAVQRSASQRAQFTRQAGSAWHRFYRNNRDKFFKDRHYLWRDWPCLAVATWSPTTLLEFGTGVGNAVLPAVARLPALRVWAYDCARSGIDILRQRAIDNGVADRVTAFVYNPSDEPVGAVPLEVSQHPDIQAAGGVDLVLMLFMLSAVDPDHQHKSWAAAAAALKPGGRLLFRDYARWDEAQLRFGAKARLSDNLYVRGDGTMAYFFTEAEIAAAARAAGLVPLRVHRLCREITNRAEQSTAQRMFLHAEFWKPPPGAAAAAQSWAAAAQSQAHQAGPRASKPLYTSPITAALHSALMSGPTEPLMHIP